MLFFDFLLSSDVRKTSEKNKMDNSQNGCSRVEKTGKIKKTYHPMAKSSNNNIKSESEMISKTSPIIAKTGIPEPFAANRL